MEAMLACYIAKVNDAHLKVAATESTAEAIEATGRRRYESQRRTGKIALLRRAGLCHQVNCDCGGDVDVRVSCGAALRSRAAGSQDELLPRCGSNSQAAPLPKLSVRRERWCGIDQFVSGFVRRRDKRTVSLYFAYYF
jgi:hypothetical protein